MVKWFLNVPYCIGYRTQLHSFKWYLPAISHKKNRTSKWPWSSESTFYAGVRHRLHIQALEPLDSRDSHTSAHIQHTHTHGGTHTHTQHGLRRPVCAIYMRPHKYTESNRVHPVYKMCWIERETSHGTSVRKKIHISFTIFSVIVVESTVYGAILQNAHTRIDPKWYVFTLARDMPMYALFYTQRHYTTVLGELRSLYRNGKELNRAEAMYYL